MRLECELTVERQGTIAKARACKGIVTIGKSRLKNVNDVSYQLQLSTSKDRNQQPIELNTQVVSQLMTKFVSAGRLSILMRQPAINIFINKANPTSLERFVIKLRAVLSGKDVDLDNLKEVKTTDFRTAPRVLVVEKREDYPRDGFPSTLETLKLNRIGLSRVDGRWFTLRLLTSLDLSSNSIGKAVNISLLANLSRLSNLIHLSLVDNQIKELPNKVWDSLPISLLSLDLSANTLTCFPIQLLKLTKLKKLNLSHNQIKEIPEVIIMLALSQFDISHNLLTIIPYTIRRMRTLQQLALAGNSFIVNIPNDSSSMHQVSCLEDLCAAAVANHGQSESILPSHVQLMLPLMRSLCAQCLRWGAKDGMKMVYRYVQTREMAVEVDGAGSVPAQARLCHNCKHVFSF